MDYETQYEIVKDILANDFGVPPSYICHLRWEYRHSYICIRYYVEDMENNRVVDDDVVVHEDDVMNILIPEYCF